MPITFVPLPGKVVQRKTNGTYESFHQSDMKMIMRDPRRQEHSAKQSYSPNDSKSLTSSQSRELQRKKLNLRGGISDMKHLQFASHKLRNQFGEEVNRRADSPIRDILARRNISADSICGRSPHQSVSNLMMETKSEMNQFNSYPKRCSTAPWLEAVPSEPMRMRNMNGRGAGHVKSMLPSNQLKPCRQGKSLSKNISPGVGHLSDASANKTQESYDWTTSASSMETTGTVMDPLPSKTSLKTGSFLNKSSETEILRKPLPSSVYERNNVITTELIRAQQASGVPLVSSKPQTPRVIDPGNKLLNPFGSTAKPMQQGYLHKAIQSESLKSNELSSFNSSSSSSFSPQDRQTSASRNNCQDRKVASARVLLPRPSTSGSSFGRGNDGRDHVLTPSPMKTQEESKKLHIVTKKINLFESGRLVDIDKIGASLQCTQGSNIKSELLTQTTKAPPAASSTSMKFKTSSDVHDADMPFIHDSADGVPTTVSFHSRPKTTPLRSTSRGGRNSSDSSRNSSRNLNETIPRFRLTEKLHPQNTKERIFDPKESLSDAEVFVEKSIIEVASSCDQTSVPPKEVEHAASQWGELTSVVDMYMHPSNNVNRKYPTPSWVTSDLKQRNAKEAFKLRV